MMEIEELRVDGGAVRSDLLMQFQADVLGVPLVRPLISECTALGAAYLAGLAVKFWKDQEEIASYWKAEKKFLGQMPYKEVSKLRSQWKKAIECAQVWEDKNL